MIAKRIKLPLVTLALSMTGCQLIGPRMQTKLPLPPVQPALESTSTLPQDVPEVKKATKVEMFAGNETTSNIGQTYISNTEKASGSGKGEYSLNFDDADLGEVAKVILSDILGKNYTLSPQVTGKVTLQTTKPLTKDELLPTLDMLLSVNNAAIVNQNGLYVIKPAAEALYSTTFKGMGATGYQLRVIPIRNVAASEVADILKPLMPEKALLQVDPKRNILLVSGSGMELNRILELVNVFDVDVMKGHSFALFTPANADAGVIIDELEQIFNNASGSSASGSSAASGGAGGGGAGGAGGAAKKDKEPSVTASSPSSFYRFIEIDRLNAILAITRRPQDLSEIETWVLRLDKKNGEGKGGVNVYKVQHHPAMELANTLNIIFGSRQQSGSSIASGRNSLSATNRTGSSGGSTGSNGMNSSQSSNGFNNQNSSSMSGNGSFGGGFGNSSNGSTNSNTLGGISGFGGSGQQQPLLPNVKIIADESNNALVIVGNAQEFATISKVLRQLDVLPLQVLIEATIAEVDLTNELQYGIEWYLTHGHNNLSGGSDGTTNPTSTTATALSSLATGVATGGFSYMFNSKNILALLQAQAINNKINVISSPSLMVLNNGEANILVGQSVPIQTGTLANAVAGSSTSSSTAVATSNTYTDTGVNLAIKPRVNSNGLVLMDLMQSVNTPVATTSSSINSPTISKRQIDTSVAVQSGETIVLGGMIQENNTQDTNGVPFLHDLPYVGDLFGGTTRSVTKTELVILLTPRVMKSRQDAQDVTDEFKRKLTGLYDDRIPASIAQ
jgi:general secretion pathway protein D